MKKSLIFYCILLLTGTAIAQTKRVYKDTVATNFFKRESGMIAADGGYTIPLSNGKVMWIFGDSYINNYDPATRTLPCLFGANNSILIQPKNDWNWKHTITLPGSKGTQSFFKDKPGGFIWPMSGFQQGDTIYVFCLNFHKNGPGQYDMKNDGQTWAKIPLSTMRVAAYEPLQNFKGIGFAQNFIKDKGYIYSYGLKQGKVYVARFHAANPDEAWTFWDGANWVTDIDKITQIGDVPGFSMHLAKIKNKYVLFSTEFSMVCDKGKDIYAATSLNITGPFTQRKVIYTIDDYKQGHLPFFYGPLVHPEYINSKNEILMDYSINGYEPCVPSCVNGRYDPDNYRPRAIRIPLKVIDADL